MNDTPTLSPAAQAVKNAVLALYQEGQVRDSAWLLERPMVAAALRATADQVVPMVDYTSSEVMLIAMNIRVKLLLIAAELEDAQ
jgi:hypothetical protein